MRKYAIVHNYDNEVRYGSDLENGFNYPRCSFDAYDDHRALHKAYEIIEQQGYKDAVLVRHRVYPVPVLIAVVQL